MTRVIVVVGWLLGMLVGPINSAEARPGESALRHSECRRHHKKHHAKRHHRQRKHHKRVSHEL